MKRSVVGDEIRFFGVLHGGEKLPYKVNAGSGYKKVRLLLPLGYPHRLCYGHITVQLPVLSPYKTHPRPVCLLYGRRGILRLLRVGIEDGGIGIYTASVGYLSYKGTMMFNGFRRNVVLVGDIYLPLGILGGFYKACGRCPSVVEPCRLPHIVPGEAFFYPPG